MLVVLIIIVFSYGISQSKVVNLLQNENISKKVGDYRTIKPF